MNEGLLRQRRNLMIISIVLFLVCIGGISIDHEITILGAKLRIENPLVIYLTLWIMYIYFFIRYIQYYFHIDIDQKNYWIEWYPISLAFSRYDLFSWWKILKGSFEFVLNNILSIFLFLLNATLNKNFSDNFFPIIFAVIVGWSSFNVYFTNQHKEEAMLFVEKNILDTTVYKIFD